MKETNKTPAPCTLPAATLLLAAAILASGCGTPLPEIHNNTVKVHAVSASRIRVAGSTIPLARLAPTLKSAGANASTAIIVSIPADATQGMQVSISSHLASNGYRKVVFTKPVQTEAFVEEKTPAGQKAAPAQPAPATPVTPKKVTSQKPGRS